MSGQASYRDTIRDLWISGLLHQRAAELLQTDRSNFIQMNSVSNEPLVHLAMSACVAIHVQANHAQSTEQFLKVILLHKTRKIDKVHHIKDLLEALADVDQNLHSSIMNDMCDSTSRAELDNMFAIKSHNSSSRYLDFSKVASETKVIQNEKWSELNQIMKKHASNVIQQLARNEALERRLNQQRT